MGKKITLFLGRLIFFCFLYYTPKQCLLNGTRNISFLSLCWTLQHCAQFIKFPVYLSFLLGLQALCWILQWGESQIIESGSSAWQTWGSSRRYGYWCAHCCWNWSCPTGRLGLCWRRRGLRWGLGSSTSLSPRHILTNLNFPFTRLFQKSLLWNIIYRYHNDVQNHSSAGTEFQLIIRSLEQLDIRFVRLILSMVTCTWCPKGFGIMVKIKLSSIFLINQLGLFSTLVWLVIRIFYIHFTVMYLGSILISMLSSLSYKCILF